MLRLFLLFAALGFAQENGPLRGSVRDVTGAGVAGAIVSIYTPTGAPVLQATADEQGAFRFDEISRGSYSLIISAQGFAPLRSSIRVPSAAIQLTLRLLTVQTEVTVTARRGEAETVHDTTPVVTVVDIEEIRSRPTPTIGNVLQDAPGVMVQQTTYGQVSPFLRGFTGYHVLNLLDGVRFNNSTFRSGPNQYLAFVEPSQAERVEAMLGPTGAQYGSDSLGGTIQVVTSSPRFASSSDVELHGGFEVFAASADASGGINGSVSASTQNVFVLGGGSARKHNDLRTVGGLDSRNVLRRFFALPDNLTQDLIGSRLQDTAFAQSSFYTKSSLLLPANQSLTAWFQRTELDNVRGYKDLLGGLGRLRSDFYPQTMYFFYTRYEKLRVGPLDSANATFSINQQRDGSIRQGLRLSDPIIADDNTVRSFGYAAQAGKSLGSQSLTFGGEIYDEHIDSSRDENGVRRRPLYPDNSRYRTFGLFLQDSIRLTPRLRVMAGGRLTHIRYRTEEDIALGVVTSNESFDDLTFNASAQYQISSSFSIHALAGRGFRAPNANDLGAVGLNDLGYEIPASSTTGALLSTSAGEGALSTGKRIEGLGPERLYNLELGLRMQTRRVYVRSHVFNAELLNPIVRRTLLFPANAAPDALGGIPVRTLQPTPEQTAQGVVTVATSFDPRAVKAFVNDGHSRYYGLETLTEVQFGSGWSARANYTYLVGRDLNPNRYARRLPPQMGFVAIRHVPSGRRIWWELSLRAAGAQNRLSGGDLDDERIGASRSRRDIADFFRSERIRPYLDANDVFTPTGETLGQIQDRVLPGVADTIRLPLYQSTAGWASVDLRAGLPLTERISLNLAAMNLLDRNYRIHGSGVDSPGRNLYASVLYRF